MGKSCTQCGETLGLWDQIKGKIDHPRCWEKNIIKPTAGDLMLDLQLPKEKFLFRLAQILYSSARTSR